MNNQGRMLGASIGGLMVIAVITIAYIIFNQMNTYTLHPSAVKNNVDSTNLNLLDIGWIVFPSLILLAYVYSLIDTGRRGGMSNE